MNRTASSFPPWAWRCPPTREQYGYLSEHHAFGETDDKAGDYAEDLAACMLATTLGIEFDEDRALGRAQGTLEDQQPDLQDEKYHPVRRRPQEGALDNSRLGGGIDRLALVVHELPPREQPLRRFSEAGKVLHEFRRRVETNSTPIPFCPGLASWERDILAVTNNGGDE